MARTVMALILSPRPATMPSSSMHSCRIMVESMSAMSSRLRRLLLETRFTSMGKWRQGLAEFFNIVRRRKFRRLAFGEPEGGVPTIATTASFIALEPGAAMRTRTDVMMNPTKAKSALLIAGPTASGKSALALTLAKERDGVIINADALQVYRELRILSARPTDEEIHAAPHRLYGHVSGLDSLFGGALAGGCQA